MTSSRETKPRGLGKGLSSLLGDAAITASIDATADTGSQKTAAERLLPIESISQGPWQPRELFFQESLDELAESIRNHGIIQPLLVRPDPENTGQYQIIAGERRWRAAQQAMLHEIPVVIRDIDSKTAAEIALIENIQRDDLSSIEEAAGYRQLMEQFGYTQETLAAMIGKSRSHIANLVRLLGLPEQVQRWLMEGQVSTGQMRPLIGHPDCLDLARTVRDNGLTARQVEQLIRMKAAPKKRLPKEKSSDIKSLERMLRDKLGLAVKLDYNPQKETGSITIRCRSLDQFDGVLQRLGIDANDQ